jgi:hypothetical protein
MTVADVLCDLRTGAGFVLRTCSLRSLFLIYLPVFGTIGLFNTVLLPFSRQALHESDSVFGLLTAADCFGLICCSLLMVRFVGRLPAGRWVALSFVGMGLAGQAISISPSVMLAALCCLTPAVTNAPVSRSSPAHHPAHDAARVEGAGEQRLLRLPRPDVHPWDGGGRPGRHCGCAHAGVCGLRGAVRLRPGGAPIARARQASRVKRAEFGRSAN